MTQSAYFDIKGEPINLDEWIGWRRDWHYRLIAEDFLDNQRMVRTLWTGYDASMEPSPYPLIFTTEVHGAKNDDWTLQRYDYHSLTEAERGHDTAVYRWGREYVEDEK